MCTSGCVRVLRCDDREILGGRDHSTVHSMINKTRRAVESGADTETAQIREILANADVLKKKLCYICPECGTRWVHGYFNGREFLPDSEFENGEA